MAGQLDFSIYSQLQGVNIDPRYFEAGREAAKNSELHRLRMDESRQKQAERSAEAIFDQRLADLFSSETPPTPAQIFSAVGPRRGLDIVNGLGAWAELKQKRVTNARDTAGRLARGLRALSPNQQQAMWPAIRQDAIAGGLGDEETIPEQPTPEFLEAVIRWATGDEPQAPRTREVKVRNADGTETIKIVRDVPGDYPSAAPPEKSPTDGSFEDYLGRYAAEKRRPVQTLSTKDIENARKAYLQSDDRPRATSEDPFYARDRDEYEDYIRAHDREQDRRVTVDEYGEEHKGPYQRPLDFQTWRAQHKSRGQRTNVASPAHGFTPEAIRPMRSAPPTAPPPSRGPAGRPATPPSQSTPLPRLQVGQVVTVRGRRIKVTKVFADGTFDGDEVR